MRKIAYVMMAVMLIVTAIFFFGKKEETAPYALTGWENRASEWTALTVALYFEGAVEESEEGLWAIAWVIKNRVMSKDFPRRPDRPDTIRGVVTDGYRKPGCAFSFACNGSGESPREFCRLQNKMGNRLTLAYCEERWAKYSRLAAKFLKNPGQDPTNGANHYWAAYVNPYWVRTDIVADSIVQIGSHKFGWSKYLGEDIPRTVALE